MGGGGGEVLADAVAEGGAKLPCWWLPWQVLQQHCAVPAQTMPD